jgi:hypothetical protein
MDAAMRYLAPRARSSREVRDHLSRKGFGAEVAAAAEARLVELGILDDAELARSSMDRAVVGRHEAPARIRETLAGRGVAPDAIDAALAEIAPGTTSSLRWPRRPPGSACCTVRSRPSAGGWARSWRGAGTTPRWSRRSATACWG